MHKQRYKSYIFSVVFCHQPKLKKSIVFLFLKKGVTSTPGWCSCDENSGLVIQGWKLANAFRSSIAHTQVGPGSAGAHRGGKGGQCPRHLITGGRWKVPTMPRALPLIQQISPKRLMFEHGGVKLVCPWGSGFKTRPVCISVLSPCSLRPPVSTTGDVFVS